MATVGDHTRNRARAARVRAAIDRYVCAIVSPTARRETKQAIFAADDLDETIACILDELANEIGEGASR